MTKEWTNSRTKYSEGGPRGVRGVCLFSELHQKIFSQKFWDFQGRELWCGNLGSPDENYPTKLNYPKLEYEGLGSYLRLCSKSFTRERSD